MTLRMWTQALREARDAWQEQAEALAGPHKNLADAEADLLGPTVAPHATSFFEAWQRQVKALRERADAHAGSLSAAMYDFVLTDTESVDRTQQLLSWEDRNTPPMGPA